MRAARNISFGYVDDEGEGHSVALLAGDEIPEDIIDEIPSGFVLEQLAQENPDKLSREQLVTLAGLDSDKVENLEPIEYDEDELREVLTELRTKADLLDWFEMVRPTSEQPEPTWKRTDITDFIVEEMVGE